MLCFLIGLNTPSPLKQQIHFFFFFLPFGAFCSLYMHSRLAYLLKHEHSGTFCRVAARWLKCFIQLRLVELSQPEPRTVTTLKMVMKLLF